MQLVIKEVTLYDKGEYSCVVWNKHGSLNYTFTLDVQRKLTSTQGQKVGSSSHSVYSYTT